jgi:hypothetical protein
LARTWRPASLDSGSVGDDADRAQDPERRRAARRQPAHHQRLPHVLDQVGGEVFGTAEHRLDEVLERGDESADFADRVADSSKRCSDVAESVGVDAVRKRGDGINGLGQAGEQIGEIYVRKPWQRPAGAAKEAYQVVWRRGVGDDDAQRLDELVEFAGDRLQGVAVVRHHHPLGRLPAATCCRITSSSGA